MLLLPVCASLSGYNVIQLHIEKRSGRGSGSISLALPCLGPGLWGLVMQWELPEIFYLPATSKKNCRPHEVRHATKTGELLLAGVGLT